MNKIALSLAGVLAAVAFAPEASALPVFARQTGAACSACHFNHFPLLNSFGRSFKSSGFTQISTSQVEGENLSLPSNLNFGVLTTAGYDSISRPANAAAAQTGGFWYVPGNGGELSLFFGGRVSENAGFLAELGMGGAGAAVGAAKMPILFDVGGTRVGVVLDTNNGQGPAHSFELLNTGAVNVHKMVSMGHEMVYSAAQYLGTNFQSTGMSIVATNDWGFLNLSKYEAAGQALGLGASSLPLTYGRVAGLFEVAGLEGGAGLQVWRGTTQGVQFGINAAGLTLAPGEYSATVVDAQLQGELGGLSTGLYTSYGRASGSSALGGVAGGGANLLAPVARAGVSATSSFNFGADLEVAHGVTVKAAFRLAKVGDPVNLGLSLGDNALQAGASYQLAQNQEIALTYTGNSGSAWNGAVVGKTHITLNLETLF